ncbi:MAG: VanZ family protein, partial [Gemmatimonadaceae bacterium]|nr:VanZ family protein [Gemmatimonadaceae bacterium]
MAWLSVLAGIVAIVGATLRSLPSPPAPAVAVGPPSMFCLSCSDLGGVDAVLNVLLFVPLGAALAAATGRWGASLAVPVALSLAIEFLQLTVITGRDASVLDLLTNATGGLIGALIVMRRRTLLTPAPRTARVLALGAAAAAVGVMASTAALLRPSVPRMGLWGQWMPQRLAFEP